MKNFKQYYRSYEVDKMENITSINSNEVYYSMEASIGRPPHTLFYRLYDGKFNVLRQGKIKDTNILNGLEKIAYKENLGIVGACYDIEELNNDYVKLVKNEDTAKALVIAAENL